MYMQNNNKIIMLKVNMDVLYLQNIIYKKKVKIYYNYLNQYNQNKIKEKLMKNYKYNQLMNVHKKYNINNWLIYLHN